jgi:hypothetical protein
VPHQLCQFHFLREAALPVFEADRHAKVLLKKPIRGVRPIERAMVGHKHACDQGRDDAEVVRGRDRRRLAAAACSPKLPRHVHG